MVEPVTISIGAILGAVASALLNAINALLEFMNKIGFIAYWLVMMGLLWADVSNSIPLVNSLFTGYDGGNFFGAIISVFSKPLFGFEISSFILFCMVLFSGCIYLLWKSKTGISMSSGM